LTSLWNSPLIASYQENDEQVDIFGGYFFLETLLVNCILKNNELNIERCLATTISKFPGLTKGKSMQID
jgi:hypothetical protein